MIPELSRGAVVRRCKFDVEVGRFYQISHDNLPPRTPSWLKSIQVVLVSEKTEIKVTVKYPSLESLKKSMSVGTMCFFPLLDKSFIMGTKLARKVLLWQVKKPEFDELEDFMAFWLLDSSLLAPKFELKEVSPKYLCSSTIEYDEEEEEHNEVDKNETRLELVKVEKDGGFEAEDLQRRKKFKWWSEKSFEDGKVTILSILKEKKATSDNPISRGALRRDAKKQIRNTGLLDHILKDIPGNLSPDGILRFQRCYNAAGVIVYWLESDDLVDVGKHGGVTDHFRIPPLDWKLGSCSSTGICSKELELLKEDLANVKRELEETKKQINEIRAGDARRYSQSSVCCDWVGGFW